MTSLETRRHLPVWRCRDQKNHPLHDGCCTTWDYRRHRDDRNSIECRQDNPVTISWIVLKRFEIERWPLLEMLTNRKENRTAQFSTDFFFFFYTSYKRRHYGPVQKLAILTIRLIGEIRRGMLIEYNRYHHHHQNNISWSLFCCISLMYALYSFHFLTFSYAQFCIAHIAVKTVLIYLLLK